MGVGQVFRRLRRDAAFTITAVGVLALGIGANTAIFTVVRAVLLRPLPYSDPSRIAVVAETNKRGVHINVSNADFHDWRTQSKSFDAIAAYSDSPMSIVAGGSPERVDGVAVSSGWFDVMGAKPQIGRLFAPSEEKPNSEKTALISESLWKRRFGGNPGVLGTKFKLQGEMYTIIGVLPGGFRFPGKTDLWVPLGLFVDDSARSAHNYAVIARLKSDVTAQQAQSEMSGIAARLGRAYPESNSDIGAAVTLLQTDMTQSARPTLYLLLAAVGFVLLIACANTGNLLLASGARRRTELAIRAALGAGRARIVRQLLAESVALAITAGVLGLVLAWLTKDALLALAPGDIPRLAEASIDPAVFGFTLAASLLTGVLFGLIPALQISRTDLNDALKSSGTRTVGGSGTGLRSVLVCAEVALSVILVAGAGLALRSLIELQNAPTGYNSQNVLVMDTSIPAEDDPGRFRSMRIYEEFLRRAEAIPGVTAVGGVSSVPLSEYGSSNGYFFEEGQAALDRTKSAGFHTASAGYFKALQIPVLAGRNFSDRDRFEVPRVCIISKEMSAKFWPKGDAIGRKISTGYDGHSKDMTIIGVVGDVRHIGLDRAPRPEIYVPFTQHPTRATFLTIVVKSTGNTSALVEPLRTAFHSLDPELPVQFTTFDAVIAQSVGSPRFRTVLLGVFAVLALALAAIGVYGLMAFITTQRIPEIGLRIALGATGGSIVGLVLGRSLRLIAIGLALGVAVSLALTRYMQSFLYGVKATDPATYIAVCLVLAVSAIAASYIPAWRASRIDPVTALRSE